MITPIAFFPTPVIMAMGSRHPGYGTWRGRKPLVALHLFTLTRGEHRQPLGAQYRQL